MTKIVMSETIRFRAPAELVEWLEGRAQRRHQRGINDRARSELLAWRDVQRLELARVEWTLPELALLAFFQQNTMPDDVVGALGALAMQLEDAQGVDWGLPTEDLTAKLRGLGPAADHAMCDAIQCWIDDEADTDVKHTLEGWARHGVKVRDE